MKVLVPVGVALIALLGVILGTSWFNEERHLRTEPTSTLLAEAIAIQTGKTTCDPQVLKILNRIISRDPQYAEAFFQRGNCYEIMADLQHAEEDYTKACDLPSENHRDDWCKKRDNVKAERKRLRR